jgi:hypothetical protein
VTDAQVGAIVAAVGYVMTIAGGLLLYQNTAPDRAFGTIPTTNDIAAFQRQQQADIESRRRANKLGFGLLTVGAVFQLAGTLLAAFAI